MECLLLFGPKYCPSCLISKSTKIRIILRVVLHGMELGLSC